MQRRMDRGAVEGRSQGIDKKTSNSHRSSFPPLLQCLFGRMGTQAGRQARGREREEVHRRQQLTSPSLPPSPPTSAFLEEWERKLDAKRGVENEKRSTVVEKARAELAKFAEEREVMRDKKQSANRKEEQVRRDGGREGLKGKSMRGQFVDSRSPPSLPHSLPLFFFVRSSSKTWKRTWRPRSLGSV